MFTATPCIPYMSPVKGTTESPTISTRLQSKNSVEPLRYVLYWLCHVASLPWSIISLSKGFGPDFSDERLERLQTYSHLQAHLGPGRLNASHCPDPA